MRIQAPVPFDDGRTQVMNKARKRKHHSVI
jgi:hypothetical protein